MPSSQRVNYDLIAHQFDEPSRDHAVGPHFVRYLDDLPQAAHDNVCVLDLGCGTGKQLAAKEDYQWQTEATVR